jgi:hypothetical protein
MLPKSGDHLIFIDSDGDYFNALVLDVDPHESIGPLCDLIFVVGKQMEPEGKRVVRKVADIRMHVPQRALPSDRIAWAWPGDIGGDTD